MNQKIKIFRSNKHIYALLITDNVLKWSISDNGLKGNKSELSRQVGEKVSERLLKENIKRIKFDRNKYKYHGRVKAVAEGIKSKGIVI